jgi:ArsR family transcriptional regulator
MNTAATPDLLDCLTALGDPTRTRLLLLLERQELTVSELCQVLQAPQSTVSRHLRALADAGWVASRPDGTRRFYRMDRADLPSSMRRVWDAVREDLASGPGAEQDRARLASVLARRRSRSEAFFASEAGEWDRMRDELFGPGFYLAGLPGLLDPGWVVGDLGCGTGHVAASLAPFVHRVVAVDGSDAMLAEARRRLASHRNVRVLHGDMESLPVEDQSLDAAVMALVLHHLPDPARALVDVARALRPGGRIQVIDMLPHTREDLAGRMGHVWLCFAEKAMRSYLEQAGFRSPRFSPLPADPQAQGPALFSVAATRPEGTMTTNPVRRTGPQEEGE